MLLARTPRLVLAVLAAAGASCIRSPLTARPHQPRTVCAARSDGAAILCDGQVFASLECQVRFYVGCTKLILRYADGDVARLYEARGDPKFDKATRVAMASDGSRLWFLETEGPFAALQWHEYDVWSGALRDAPPEIAGQVEVAVGRGAAIPLARNLERAPGVQ